STPLAPAVHPVRATMIPESQQSGILSCRMPPRFAGSASLVGISHVALPSAAHGGAPTQAVLFGIVPPDCPPCGPQFPTAGEPLVFAAQSSGVKLMLCIPIQTGAEQLLTIVSMCPGEGDGVGEAL